MKFEREYLLRADLKEEIEEWIRKVKWVNASEWEKEMLAEMIFYRLLHAGDLREDAIVADADYRKKIKLIRKQYIDDRKDEIRMIDVTGLTKEEAYAKVEKIMEEWRKEIGGGIVDAVELKTKTIHFKVKGLSMKVDADSPFKGERI